MLRALAFFLAISAISAAASSAQAQRPASGQPRQLAPGVLTVIPPTVEVEETFTEARPLVALTENPDLPGWVPNFEPPSDTLEAIAAETVFRNTVWQVEFAFKPLRMIEVDVPQPNGLMERKLIWYMVFRVRNLGGHLNPTPGEWQRENSELVTADETVAVDPETGRQIVIEGRPNFELDESAEAAGQDSLYGARRVDFPVRCFPAFALRAHDYDEEYLDRLIPTAIPAIQEREDPNRPLLSTIEIGQHWLQVSDSEEDGLWGVATWENINPEIDFFSIYVEGLSSAYRWQEAGEGDPPVDKTTYTQKTLQLNFWRPGDALNQNEEEIRFGLPPATVQGPDRNLLEMYELPRRLDYLWIYR